MAEATPEEPHASTASPTNSADSLSKPNPKSRPRNKEAPATAKRRCVSTACIACRRRKSKCDGNTPSCAACSSVYGTECVYDPNSDHRRKGVYKKDVDNLKTRSSTLHTLIQAIVHFPEHEVPALVRQIRTSDNLDDVAESIILKDDTLGDDGDDADSPLDPNEMLYGAPKFVTELSEKMGEMRLENGSVSYIGGTSNLLFLDSGFEGGNPIPLIEEVKPYQKQEDVILSWTEATPDPVLVMHLINMYFTWHYTYFATLSKSLFYRDFRQGKPVHGSRHKTEYCTSLLVNAMLALGCHFTSWPASRDDPLNSATAGDHFFREAKRLILTNDEHENPRLATVQALALMSVREAGCGREAKGWVYSGMSFRMACDLGLNVDSGSSNCDEQEMDARRMTIWGCFLFDKCWSNYLGRQPQLPLSSIAVSKFDVFPMEDADTWSPYMDGGIGQAHSQPSRTRAVALQISALCEISSDLLLYFYNPTHLEKPLSRQAELKKLSDLHMRLETWHKNLPKEMEPKEGQLPNVLVMHMFFQLLFIHLFRPFLKYKPENSPLPSHVSPRKFCTHAAAMISKLLRLYKRTYGFGHICNIAVYIAHSACTLHLLNLPDKNAVRDIIHGLKHLEEIAESWLCARRTLWILHTVARRWNVALPEDAAKIFQRTTAKFGIHRHEQESPRPTTTVTMATESSPQFRMMYQTHSPTFAVSSQASLQAPTQGTSPIPSPELSNGGAMPLHGHSTVELDSKPPQPPFTMPRAQPELWRPDVVTHASIAATDISPSVVFGGTESLVEESRDWWLKDQATFFDNWYGPEPEAALLGNDNMNGFSNVEFGANTYGMNGGNGFVAANGVL